MGAVWQPNLSRLACGPLVPSPILRCDPHSHHGKSDWREVLEITSILTREIRYQVFSLVLSRLSWVPTVMVKPSPSGDYSDGKL